MEKRTRGKRFNNTYPCMSLFFWESPWEKVHEVVQHHFVILLNWKEDMLWDDCYWNSSLVLIAKCHYLVCLDHCWQLLIKNSLKPKNVVIGAFQEPALGLSCLYCPKTFPYLCSRSLLFHINPCLMIRTRNTGIVKGYCKNRTKPHLLFLCSLDDPFSFSLFLPGFLGTLQSGWLFFFSPSLSYSFLCFPWSAVSKAECRNPAESLLMCTVEQPRLCSPSCDPDIPRCTGCPAVMVLFLSQAITDV